MEKRLKFHFVNQSIYVQFVKVTIYNACVEDKNKQGLSWCATKTDRNGKIC